MPLWAWISTIILGIFLIPFSFSLHLQGGSQTAFCATLKIGKLSLLKLPFREKAQRKKSSSARPKKARINFPPPPLWLQRLSHFFLRYFLQWPLWKASLPFFAKTSWLQLKFWAPTLHFFHFSYGSQDPLQTHQVHLFFLTYGNLLPFKKVRFSPLWNNPFWELNAILSWRFTGLGLLWFALRNLKLIPWQALFRAFRDAYNPLLYAQKHPQFNHLYQWIKELKWQNGI